MKKKLLLILCALALAACALVSTKTFADGDPWPTCVPHHCP